MVIQKVVCFVGFVFFFPFPSTFATREQILLFPSSGNLSARNKAPTGFFLACMQSMNCHSEKDILSGSLSMLAFLAHWRCPLSSLCHLALAALSAYKETLQAGYTHLQGTKQLFVALYTQLLGGTNKLPG